MSRSTRVAVAVFLVLFGCFAFVFLGDPIPLCSPPVGLTVEEMKALCARATGVVPGLGIGLPIFAASLAMAAFVLAGRKSDRNSVALVISAMTGGAFVVAAVTVFIMFSTGPKTMFLGMNVCMPPCPQSTVAYGGDWLTGRTWATKTTTDVDGSVIGSSVSEMSPARYTVPEVLIAPALIGAFLGGTLGLIAVGEIARVAASRERRDH